MLGLVVACVLAATCFPVWPIWARVLLWYVILIFGTLYLMLECTRISCFCTGWILGAEFWILPNLNDEYCAVLDSFKPLYSFERRRDGWTTLLTRLVLVAIAALAAEEIGKTHSIGDLQDFATTTYSDIAKWGEERFANPLQITDGGARMSLPDLKDLEEEEEAENRKTAAPASEEESAFDQSNTDL